MNQTQTARISLTPPLLALMGLGFFLGCSELTMVGILPGIAQGLGTSLTAAGRLVSLFAVGFALGTPLVTAATGRVPRRRLLGVLLGVLLVLNGVSMLAPNLAVLALCRLFHAPLSGALTAVAVLYARELAPAGQASRAISLVYLAFSLAAVAGVPLGTAVSVALGWRWTFAMILALGAALTPVLLHLLPETPPPAETSLLRQFAVLRDRRLSVCAGMIFCSGAATYTVYTYLTPILTDALGVSQTIVSLVLVAMGLCCAAGNVLSGRLGERGGVRRLPPVFAAQCVLFSLLPLLLQGRWTGLLALLAMGLLMYLLNIPVQLHALEVAARDYPFAGGLCASIQPVSFNLGIAVGSLVGGAVQARWGLGALGLPAAVFALGALALSVGLLRLGRMPRMAAAPIL